jgi:GNAT superfamily N-acetyltransferase
MKGKVNVRFATLHDASFVGQDGYVPRDVIVRKIENREAVVAEREGEPVGYVRIEYLWSMLPYIAIIRVVPECRRQGIGRAMLSFLETWLCEQGHTTLYSSSQANEPEPQAWHRHMGFKECGIIAGINEGDIGEVFFRKRLVRP